MARKVIAACGGSVRGKTIAILGLTFKPNTDDMREAPSLAIIRGLQDAGARIKAYDPAGMETAAALTDDVEFGVDAYEIAVDASALVIVTEWSGFGALDLRRLKELMASPLLIDLRNIYVIGEIKSRGFMYVRIGTAKSSTQLAQLDAI